MDDYITPALKQEPVYWLLGTLAQDSRTCIHRALWISAALSCRLVYPSFPYVCCCRSALAFAWRGWSIANGRSVDRKPVICSRSIRSQASQRSGDWQPVYSSQLIGNIRICWLLNNHSLGNWDCWREDRWGSSFHTWMPGLGYFPADVLLYSLRIWIAYQMACLSGRWLADPWSLQLTFCPRLLGFVYVEAACLLETVASVENEHFIFYAPHRTGFLWILKHMLIGYIYRYIHEHMRHTPYINILHIIYICNIYYIYAYIYYIYNIYI